jgi:hypothetical protein
MFGQAEANAAMGYKDLAVELARSAIQSGSDTNDPLPRRIEEALRSWAIR